MSESKNKSHEELLKLAREEWAPEAEEASAESEGPVAFVAQLQADATLARSVRDDQQNDEELELDADLIDDLDSEELAEGEAVLEGALLSDEETNAKLDRLAEAMKAETERQVAAFEADTAEDSVQDAVDSEAELAKQIAEDQEIESELQAEAEAARAEADAALRDFSPEDLESCLEALLFLADRPLSRDKLREMLGDAVEKEVMEAALERIETRYQSSAHGVELARIGGGVQFRTKPARADIVRKLAKVQVQRLSKGAMETLAIIAYRQPVMKEEIDKVRGVDSSHFVRGLLEKRLIAIRGRSELPGRPMLYGTTQEFLEIFSLASLQDLPPLSEIEAMIPQSQVGQEDDPRVIQMRKMVAEMAEASTELDYKPGEDDAILSDIRERVKGISASTPYLELQDTLEKLMKDGSIPTEAFPLEEVTPHDLGAPQAAVMVPLEHTENSLESST